ncbi:winged helix-turn-helix domain-containing protein [Stakelama pacifica]|uniref:Molybdate transport system regulatory protein n=1 Tax=Stakelama pacifica TaxID=517720 RepID=A0A4R6FC55_9SPHN|nr:LysR family transcriptional regulator [Stakelama pacifica]MAW99126.1 ModE family transcriptional regulator [Sphingomonas sp.]MAX00610.1 ModE family transcriptional regulator [Sphingomonas sp.]TDN78779.1 molybdate transport system regulatory protein [Stakelama pacifica]GGO99131.1 ModE family transcriptional regulator [Stakelama pacifica]
MRIGALKLKLQLFCGDAIAIGPGKADLLDAIARGGSISAAGREMGMSYRRSWLLVDEMNRCWSAPLVEAHPGGGKRRGARLTATGERVLALYRALERELESAAKGGSFAALAEMIRTEPVHTP